MRYIESPSNDAFFNMALEEYLFEGLPPDDDYFMLWQNQNAIVVGRYQNTAEELDAAYVKEHGIQVVRRLSGGGAMYQDLGNLNFTFVVNQNASKTLDFSVFIQPVVRALAQMGVTAQQSSRNDITIDGKKFSGNSQYNKRGRTMHHGTLLFNSNLGRIGSALRVRAEKIESKGVKSVRSRVTNIAPYLPASMELNDFKRLLVAEMFSAGGVSRFDLTEADLCAAQKLRDEKYATWEWNWGRSPAFGMRKYRRYPFGGVTAQLSVSDGLVAALSFEGDFFGNGDIEDLAAALTGCRFREEDLLAALDGVDVGSYILGMDAAALVELLLY